jgi:glutathione peroxidase-family protein
MYHEGDFPMAMKRKVRLWSALLMALGVSSVPAAGNGGKPPLSIYGFTLSDINGKPVPLSEFRGKVMLVVNVASRCGFTYQYEGLESVYRKYKERGFVVLGFPSNDFLGQEPGTNERIKEFCTLTYGVTFPMFGKIAVKGRDIHPLYRYLTAGGTNGEFAGRITWNFNKFLIGRDGRVLARFGSREEPAVDAVIEAVEAALGSH